MACLYISCRQEGCPRTFKEICAINEEVNKTKIQRYFKKIINLINANLRQIRTDDFMARFCGKLSLSRSILKISNCIAIKAFERCYVLGRCPISVAAAAIFLATQWSNEKRTRKEVSNVTGVVEPTIKQVYNLMIPHIEELFPQNFKFIVS